jgi:endonuclease YncB( thermonuclease family)
MASVIGVSELSNSLKRVRVFVRKGHFRYGDCSKKALENAIENNEKVSVSFTRYRMINKEAVPDGTSFDLVHPKYIVV